MVIKKVVKTGVRQRCRGARKMAGRRQKTTGDFSRGVEYNQKKPVHL